MTPASYHLHGLTVASCLELAARAAAPDGSLAPDVTVDLGAPRNVGADLPPGRMVAELVTEEQRWYSITGDGPYVLRFHGVCDVIVSADLSHVTCHVDPAWPVDVASTLVSGTVLSFIVSMQGALVLHASTVQYEDLTVAIAGPRGTGKSTMAAVLCAAGARLVGDDVLVVDREELHCQLGTTAIRLRPSVWRLARLIDGGQAGTTTGDGRLAVVPPAAATPPRLSVVVVPRPRRPGADLRVVRFAQPDALLCLLAAQRIDGWRLVPPRRLHFEGAAQLARSVPVVEAGVPWSGTSALDLGTRLLQALAVVGRT